MSGSFCSPAERGPQKGNLKKVPSADDEADFRPAYSAEPTYNKLRFLQSGYKGEDRPSAPAKCVFVDAAAMKEKMRAQLAKPEYDVRNFYKTTGIAASIARSPWFDRVSLAVIAFNALWISVDTDYNDSLVLTDATWPFQVADHSFCFFFFTEWAVRFFAFEFKRDGLRDAWFCFDFVMVVMMVTETWIMTLILYFMDAGGGGLGNAGVLKLLRLTRLTRMARMARLLRAMPELLVLLKGMWAATRSVFFTLLLLFIIIYVFGIVFTQMTEGTDIGEEYFHSVPASMHTLLLHGTLMDEMTDIVNGLGAASSIFSVVFYLFLLISSLTVMNMLIGVLCEVVAAVAATEKEESSVAYVKWQIRDIMRKGGLDLDGDGMISKEEFVKLIDNAQATRTLSNAGVDVFGLVDCADFIFGEDEPGGRHEDAVQLSFADFMEVVLQLRGTNVATVKDLVDLRKFLTVTTRKLDDKVTRIGRDAHTVSAYVMKISNGLGSLSPDAEQELSPRPDTHQRVLQQQVTQESESFAVLQVNQADRITTPAALTRSSAPAVLSRLPAPTTATMPSLTNAGAALRSDIFDQVNLELDQLRQYVDTELVEIMQDLTIMSRQSRESPRHESIANVPTNSAVRLPSGNNAVPESLENAQGDCKIDNDLIQSPETLPFREGSSVMCPGAELRCLGTDKGRRATCGL